MAALASDWLRHFRLLLWKFWTELNETWQEARSQRPLPSLYFSCWSENKKATLASDWLRHFLLLLWNRWTEFNDTWQEARSQRPLPCLYYSGRSETKNGHPGLKKVAHCTQVHEMGPFGPLVYWINQSENCAWLGEKGGGGFTSPVWGTHVSLESILHLYIEHSFKTNPFIYWSQRKT